MNNIVVCVMRLNALEEYVLLCLFSYLLIGTLNK